MNVSRVTRFVGAPVAVVLATVVNASAFDPGVSAREPVQADLSLSWALNHTAAEAASARTLIAKRAVSKIRSIERVSAQPDISALAPISQPGFSEFAYPPPPGQLHVNTSHQHAAP